MVRFLQKRKFRLVTRWKTVLKENIGASLPLQNTFPYALIFRAFDELIHLLKLQAIGVPAANDGSSFLAALDGGPAPTADHYMELFLSGRDVLAEFLSSDAGLSQTFTAEECQAMRAQCEHAFRHLIDREMREYARRFSSGAPR
jgi:hypothetical protein